MEHNYWLTLIAVLGIVIVALMAALFLLPSKSQAPTTGKSTPMLLSDVYPLYQNAQWQEPQAETLQLGTTTVSGVKANSEPFVGITDLAAVSTPFDQYYATKLTRALWKEDVSLAAGGPGSSSRVYRKGSSVIVASYHSDFLNLQPNEPEQCPCDLTLSIFTSNK